MDIRYRFFIRGDGGELMSNHDGSFWSVGEWRETPGTGELCSAGWLHCYDTPELAEFHNPIDAEYDRNAEMWRVECEDRELRRGAMKCGWTRMRPIERIERAIPTVEQCVRYAIFSAMSVLPPDEPWVPGWRRWAEGWLSGSDRSAKSVEASRRAVARAARAALVSRAATVWAEAAEAAQAAGWAGWATWAADVWAARAARAARAAEARAAPAAETGELDLAAIARRAMSRE